MQGCFLSPTRQAVERRTWVPACFDGVGDGLSGFLDRLGSRLNGLLGLVELVWAIDIFADHLSSPRQRRSTPGTENRSQTPFAPHCRVKYLRRFEKAVDICTTELSHRPVIFDIKAASWYGLELAISSACERPFPDRRRGHRGW